MEQSVGDNMAAPAWFHCPSCDRMITGLVQRGHPHPGKHHVYSYTHCCQPCEQGQSTHAESWACAGVPSALFRSVKLNSGLQHYLLHDPGGDSLPVVLFLHGANTYIYPETLWWDVEKLVEKNEIVRDGFIVIAPFGSMGEPVVQASSWAKKDRFYNEVPYVKCFDLDILWSFFVSALTALGGKRVDPARLHVTGYSMGGQAAWGLASRFGSHLASVAPMAARCAWEDGAWDHQVEILCQMQRLPLWSYAGKEDSRAVSWRDLWWLADQRGHSTTASEHEICVDEKGIEATVHAWSPNLSLTLLQGTPTSHCIWDAVLHHEAAFGLFHQMLSSKCFSPLSVEASEDLPLTHKRKHSRSLEAILELKIG
ncbi:unnamed protein product [Durusdinium trenchii]|uniref:Uncharacterized protein n=1 Tax=Durusdinium trenchii TaxID=1381693 RepID=A0ABP0KWI7_9DINO